MSVNITFMINIKKLYWHFNSHSIHIILFCHLAGYLIPFLSQVFPDFFFCKPNPLTHIQNNYVIILFYFLFTSHYFILFLHLKRFLIPSLSQVFLKKNFKLNLFIYILILFPKIYFIYTLTFFWSTFKPTYYHFFFQDSII